MFQHNTKKHYFMKKITLWLFALLTCWQVNAQTCSQTFTATGQDDDPTVLTINAADITCYGANPLTSLRLINPAGSLTSADCSADGSEWFGFDLSVDGGPIITGCAAAFNNLDITGFTTLTITSHDDDVFSDEVTITIGVEATFVPLTPPSCVAVSSPLNGAINVSSSVVSWPAAAGGATGYRLSVGSSSGATDVLNNFDVGNVLSYSLTGLVGGSTYYVTVFPYNVNGAATGCVESNFTTCDVFTVPFLETFDSTSSSESCWSVLNVNGDGDAWNTSYTTTPITGNESANINTDFNGGLNNDWLISPRITLTGNQRLVFKYKVQSSFEPNDFRVMLSTTGNAPANFTTELASLASYSNTAPATMALDLTGVSGDVYFAWHVPSGGLDGWRIYIDDVVVEDTPAVAPSCVAITSPANNAVNVMNSNVTWASDLDATGYRISVGTTSGATDVLNNFDVGNVLSYSFPTDAGSTYFVTVFPYNTFGQATGCTEINFTTCDALTVPHLEQFGTFLPSCWQAADGGGLIAGPASFGTSSWAADGFANAGGTGAIKINIDFTGDNDWVISPVVNIPATGYELKFDAAVTQWNGTGAPTTPWEADDFVEVLVSTTGLNNWTVLYTYNNTNVPAPTGTTHVINLNTYLGSDVRFAFRGVEGAANGGADVDFFIDNFEIRLTPASAPVCATNVVATPNPTCGNFANAITWDAVAGADGYNITIGTTTGGNNIANNVNLGNVLSYSFSGNANTTYYFTISPYNGVGPAIGCSEVSFTTSLNACFCSPTYTNGGGGDNITNVAIGAWSNTSTGNVNPYYEDFTLSQPATIAIPNLSAGTTVSLAVTMGTDGTQFSRVWIDFNQNTTFEPSESFSLGTNAGGSGTSNINITIPAGATLGQTRMRIRGGDDSAITNTQACGPTNSTWGQTEDYFVNIIAATCSPVVVASSTLVADCGNAEFSVNVDVTALGDGTPVITDGTNNWPITATGVITVGPFADGASVTLTALHGADSTCNLPLGIFTNICPPTNDACVDAIAVDCGDVVNGSTANGATNSGNNASADVWYSYNGAAGDITVSLCTNTAFDTLIRVFDACGGTEIISNDDSCGLQSSATFTANGTSTYYIMVEGFGTATGTFEMTVACVLSNEDFNSNSFTAYPNPVRDILNISYTSEISSVRVINMIGQEVISRNINATSTQVDMSELSAGTYIVNVTVGDSVKTLKVVKQ